MHILEPLAKSHDREGFDCGSQPLNLFLRHTARQHGERGISRTFVLVEENAAPPKPILGYFALNLCQIKAESLTPDEARKLPRDVAGVRLADWQWPRLFSGRASAKPCSSPRWKSSSRFSIRRVESVCS